MAAHERWSVLRGALVLVAALAGSAASRADPLSPAEFIRLGAGVIKIEAIRQQGGYSLGSGVIVAPDRVATNCHVTRDAIAMHVLHLGQRFPVQAQAADAGHDVCMLSVAGLEGRPLPLGRANRLAAGATLTAVGFTGGMGLQASQGEIVGLHPLDGARVIQSTNWFNSGASGGALLDERGELVGLLTFRMRGGEAHYYSAPVEWLLPLLEPQARYEPVAPLPADALAFWQRPVEAQPEFLQAAALARSQRWTELMALASKWSQVSVRNPEPWFALGMAAEALEQRSEAVVSFQRAVDVDPKFAVGWLRLGLLYARLGMRERAVEVQSILARLNAGLAAQLSERL